MYYFLYFIKLNCKLFSVLLSDLFLITATLEQYMRRINTGKNQRQKKEMSNIRFSLKARRTLLFQLYAPIRENEAEAPVIMPVVERPKRMRKCPKKKLFRKVAPRRYRTPKLGRELPKKKSKS